jgi:NTE family protein
MGQAMEMMQGNLARLRLAAYRPDLLIELPRDCCAVYEFYRAEEMIALGHAMATQRLADWPIARALQAGVGVAAPQLGQEDGDHG